MPDQTPIYDFTYPCPGEVVNEASFSTLTGEIDAVTTTLDTAAFYALNRYNVLPVIGNSELAAVGVTTLPTPQYVFPADGIWEVYAELTGFGSGETTINGHRVFFLHNATEYHGQTQNTEANTAIPPWAQNVLIVAAGDTLRVRYFWSGTGGPRSVTAMLSARMLCRLA